jgi:hypothetical protein
MRIEKQPPLPERVRKIPESFSWVDHRLMREGHVQGRSAPALALYLALLTVADSQGLSYWSEEGLAKKLSLSLVRLREARSELEAADLVAYDSPIWQVLSLPGGGR